MVDYIAEFFNSMYEALVINIGVKFVEILPGIIVALVIVFFGWLLARVIKRIVIKILQSTKVDQWIDEQNLTAAIGGKEVSALVGSLTKWYIIGVFLAQAVSYPLLQLNVFSDYLKRLFVFTADGPTPIFFAILGAAVVVVAGLLAARYFRNLIEATTYKLKKVAGVMAEAIVLVFAGMLALTLVVGHEVANVLVSLLYIFLTPLVWAFSVMLAIVVGISLLANNKAELKKISDELKKAVK